MVMAYCKRGAIMDSHELPCSPLAHGDCRRWFTDAVAGLAYLHYQDIVHFGQHKKIYIDIDICMYVCICVCTYIYFSVYICVCVCVYVCIHCIYIDRCR